MIISIYIYIYIVYDLHMNIDMLYTNYD